LSDLKIAMLQRLTSFIDLILYGNFWIAGGALALSLQSYWVLFGRLDWSPLWPGVFCGAWCLYSVHRLSALDAPGEFSRGVRFRSVMRFRRHIFLFATLGALLGAYFFFRLPGRAQVALIVPGLLAFGYVAPVLGRGRRLRDVSYLKVFLVAAVWAWVTAALPALLGYWLAAVPAALMLLERFFFLFAAALAFDIRDIPLDARSMARTLPMRLGVGRAKLLAALSMLLMLCCAWLNWRADVYTAVQWLGLAFCASLALLIILLSDRLRHDYFFSGLLDGVLTLQFVLVCGGLWR
jgi:4-hydroxybenzoate polyprenyltransferase